MLTALGVEVKVLREEFPDSVKDVEYLPRLRDTGWILITADKHILTRRAEAKALKESSVTALFFGAYWSKMNTWDQATWLMRHWPKIEAFVANHDPGTIAGVQQNGSVNIIKI